MDAEPCAEAVPPGDDVDPVPTPGVETGEGVAAVRSVSVELAHPGGLPVSRMVFNNSTVFATSVRLAGAEPGRIVGRGGNATDVDKSKSPAGPMLCPQKNTA